MPRLVARPVGQPEDPLGPLSLLANLGLDLDPARVEADERMRDSTCEHAADARDRSVTSPWSLLHGARDQHVFEVLAGAASRSPVDVPPQAMLELQPRALEDLRIEVAPIV